jgi:hypothetical protein
MRIILSGRPYIRIKSPYEVSSLHYTVYLVSLDLMVYLYFNWILQHDLAIYTPFASIFLCLLILNFFSHLYPNAVDMQTLEVYTNFEFHKSIHQLAEGNN